MRRARWLILAAITIIVVVLASTYSARLARMEKEAPAAPKPLTAGIDATAEGWRYRKADATRRGPDGEPCPVVEVAAKSFKQVKEPASFDLEGVDLKFFRRCGQTFDEVKSAKASFDTSSGMLYSEGEVEITMGLHPEENGPNRLIRIVSSGVHFESQTGKAFTDRAAAFTFDKGDGKAVGADYDPNNRQLHMKSQVELNWRGGGPKAVPMKVETQDLVYYEQLSVITLDPWAKLTRGATRVEGGKTFVTLAEDRIQKVESDNARGVQKEPGRNVEYSAGHVVMEFNEEGIVNKVTGDRDAKLLSISDTGQTSVHSGRIELGMKPEGSDSVLERALASGQAVVESKPAVKQGTPPGDTRLLKSDVIEMKMRTGGREIDSVETHAPGTLEFIPNRPAQPRRFLKGEKFWIAYGPENQVQSFRTIQASTRTDNPPRNGKPVPPIITSSKEFKATFDPKTHQVAQLEQTTDFRYEQGDRKAQADRALLDERSDRITLTGAARVTDPSGGAAADTIVINQQSDEFIADGHVTSTRLPDKKKGGAPGMLSSAEPVQAKANRMISTNRNQNVRYEGNAVAWQGANRIQADRIEIDREKQTMHAAGSVVSQFVDKPPKPKDGKPQPLPAQPQFTVVKAPEMFYTDKDRLARYLGGAVMNRPNMTVNAREIKAYLTDSESDSSLDRAFADGAVTIVQTRRDRTRTGTSEHAEYYAADEKIILTGGQPQFVDSLKGTTKGKQLTYFAKDDRLLVDGVESQRAESTIIRRKGD